MGRILIIGAGGVGNVVTNKCADAPESFTDIMLASRTVSKCERIADAVRKRTGRVIQTAKVDAGNLKELVSLIKKFKPDVITNVGMPYENLNIMEACLETGTHYVDTASYERPEGVSFEYFEYGYQWKYHKRFKDKGLLALLGCGSDPGMSNAFCAYAQKHLFDKILYIDILDCNAGNHGQQFATNFNSEINIREVAHPTVRYWKDRWVDAPSVLNPNHIHFTFDYPVVGKKDSYLLSHEELESLAKNIKGVRRIRFWMTFSESYLTYLAVLHNLGLTRTDEVYYEGRKIVPLKFLTSFLPVPAELGRNYTGKTVIGAVITGIKNNKIKSTYIYNVCDHADVFREVGAQAVSYTAGVPAMIASMLVVDGVWKNAGVFNMEQFDPDPFMKALGKYGMPWKSRDFKGSLPDGSKVRS